MDKRQRITRSFQDLSPREYMYFPTGSMPMGKPGSFSRVELIHLAISLIVLTVAFSFALSVNTLLSGFRSVESFLLALPVAFLGILTAFFVHELAHKFMAQRYGLWAEFRMYPKGLFLSIIVAFLTGVVFAAPGAVMFRGETRPFETGRIAAAGPSANIVIAYVMFPLYLWFFEHPLFGKITGFVCLVNALLGTFNLLPIGPLDGRKIIRWNGIIWALLLVAGISILWIIMGRAPFF